MATADDLGQFAAFERLDATQRAAVAASAQEVTFDGGARLFEEGDEAIGCWLIQSGRVALETFVAGRGWVIIQTLEAGDVLGWSWLVPPRVWHFSATATTPVTAIALDTDQLRALADHDPVLGYPLALGLFEMLLARLQHTRARLLDVYRSPRER